MAFIKKILVLKQVERSFSQKGRSLGGICRIEIENGVGDLYLTVVNALPTDGHYRLVVIDSSFNQFVFNLGSYASTFHQTFTHLPNIASGFCVGLCAVKNDIPLTIAFALDEQFNYSLGEFKKTMASLMLDEYKTRPKDCDILKPAPQEDSPCEPTPVKTVYPPEQEPSPTVTPPEEFPSPKSEREKCEYNDEAVATENYFKKDGQLLCDRLEIFREYNNGKLRLEDDVSIDSSENQAEQGCACDYRNENETDGDFIKKDKKPYYLSVAKELDTLFEKFPEDNSLSKILPDSRFVRINYSNERFYVVGIVKEEGKEKYICYGVPDNYSPYPPKPLKDCATFIPLSLFDLTGKGFWMIFQDALSGECIRPEKVC